MFESAVSTTLEVIMLLGVFIGVLALTYIVTKKIASIKQGTMKQKNMRIIEVLPLAQNQYIYIMQVGKSYHLFTSSKDGLRYCRELDESNLQLEEITEQTFGKYLSEWKQTIQEKKNESTKDK